MSVRTRGKVLFPVALAALAAGVAFAAPAGNHLPMPRADDTIARAHLSPAERADVIGQIARTSFDTPGRWRSELRLRRVGRGDQAYLVARGSDLLCGGTGGCETWLFRRQDGRWRNSIAGEAPVAESVELARHVTHGQRDLIVGNRESASRSRYVLYAYDGARYRPLRCFEAETNAQGFASTARRPIACRP